MDISRELAIQILQYLATHKDFYFPFQVVNKEYSDDSDFMDINPSEWRFIEQNKKYQTFQLWENLQNLYKDTTPLLAMGFIEKITDDLRKITFTITEDEIKQTAHPNPESRCPLAKPRRGVRRVVPWLARDEPRREHAGCERHAAERACLRTAGQFARGECHGRISATATRRDAGERHPRDRGG